MSNKLLGAIAMLCAPFLCIDFLVHGQAGPNEEFEHTSLSGVFSLIYMIGWMCSIIVLKRVAATGYSAFGRFILNAQLFTLTVANVWNVWEIVQPGANSPVYQVLDLFWPLSQVVMIAVGVTVIVARRLSGFERYVPLMAGLWFPISLVFMLLIGQNYLTMILSGVYSAVMWFLLGLVCFCKPGRVFAVRTVSIGCGTLG